MQSAADADGKRIEAVLTPGQLTLLKDIDFRRKVVLALGYPEKRTEIGMTDGQLTELHNLEFHMREELHTIDRAMLDRALEILTVSQREQLKTVIDNRFGG